jgi:acyl-homoserine-lactone acylase
LTYSQSDDPASEHFSDQTALYSSKTWRPLPFSREQIEADPGLSSMEVSD